MICPGCNFNNNDSNIRCEYCGTQLKNTPQINQDPNSLVTPMAEENKTESNVIELVGAMKGINYIIVGGLIAFPSIKSVFSGSIISISIFLVGISLCLYGISPIISLIIKNKTVKDLQNGKIITDQELQSRNKKAESIKNIGYKIYLIGFSIIWFGFLILLDFIFIGVWENGGNTMFLFSLIFWVAGIFALIKNLKKN